MGSHFSIAIHGGAGTVSPASMTPERERTYKEALIQAIQAGVEVLEGGGLAAEAAAAAVCVLEDCVLFNAGKGAVFTHEGTHELDASLMDGRERKAGAVAGVKHIKNPILLAKKVMEQSEHVFLLGEGAERFAWEQGFERVENKYFSTEFRLQQLEKIRDSNRTQLDHVEDHKKRGTVGAVVRDIYGNLAAATSTGGMTNKRYGRVGDTPLIGCGTYADNAYCAVSATGWGEFFIRGVVAYDVAALMAYRGLDLQTAAELVIHQKLSALSPIAGELGDGGLIAVDKNGNICMPFNTAGMYRAAFRSGGSLEVGIYK